MSITKELINQVNQVNLELSSLIQIKNIYEYYEIIDERIPNEVIDVIIAHADYVMKRDAVSWFHSIGNDQEFWWHKDEVIHDVTNVWAANAELLLKKIKDMRK